MGKASLQLPEAPAFLRKALTGPIALSELPEEGSSKKFYRLKKPRKALLMVIKEHKANRGGFDEWLEAHKLLEGSGIPVPKVLLSSSEDKSLLIEDCGTQTLTEKLNKLHHEKRHDDFDTLCTQVVSLLGKFQTLSTDEIPMALDASELLQNLDLFRKEYLAPRKEELGKTWNPKAFEEEASSLCEFLASQETALTHRDFHSDNFLVKENGELVLIDFQDACAGNKIYDFVSFFLNPYLEISPEFRSELFRKNLALFQESQEENQKIPFEHLVKAQTAQRVYKILGSFAFLGRQDGKEKFLSFIDPVLNLMPSFFLRDSRWPYLTETLWKGLSHGC